MSGVARWVTRAATALVVCVSALSPAQAVPDTGARMTDNLYGTCFVSSQDGWAVGAFGTIVHSRDSGQSWRPQVSHTVENLFSVDFADGQHGWVVGRTGIILHTDDGGDTWSKQTDPLDRHLFKVKAVDAQRAWAVGDWGTIVTTQDAGKTWENRSMSRDVILNGEAWVDAQHGWIVGESGTILATTDGGTTWTDQTSGVDKTLFGVFFADAQHGWAVGIDGIILRTADGGQTWQALHGSTEVSTLEQVGFAEAMGNPSLYDIAVAGDLGYAVGDIGAIFASRDGGATWARDEMPGQSNLLWLRAVSLVRGTHGAFVGANGLTVRVEGNQIVAPNKDAHAAETTH